MLLSRYSRHIEAGDKQENVRNRDFLNITHNTIFIFIQILRTVFIEF